MGYYGAIYNFRPVSYIKGGMMLFYLEARDTGFLQKKAFDSEVLHLKVTDVEDDGTAYNK